MNRIKISNILKIIIFENLLFNLLVLAQNSVISNIENKDRCLKINEEVACNASIQSGCEWCTSDWGCMLTKEYDIPTQQSFQFYSCPTECTEYDTECYMIDENTSMTVPFFFSLSTNKEAKCKLTYTRNTGGLHNFHCNEMCRKALIEDFKFCQIYDENGKLVTDYRKTGRKEEGGNNTLRNTLIIVGSVIVIVVGGFIYYKVYTTKHNKILQKRQEIENMDSKLENDEYLRLQIEQHINNNKNIQEEGEKASSPIKKKKKPVTPTTPVSLTIPTTPTTPNNTTSTQSNNNKSKSKVNTKAKSKPTSIENSKPKAKAKPKPKAKITPNNSNNSSMNSLLPTTTKDLAPVKRKKAGK